MNQRTAYKLVAKDPITVMAHPHAAFLRYVSDQQALIEREGGRAGRRGPG